MDFLLDWLLVTAENQLAYEGNRMVDGLEAARKKFGVFMPKAFEVTIKESIELATKIVKIKTERESTLRNIRRDKHQINNCIIIPTGWKGWWGMVEKEAKSIECQKKNFAYHSKGKSK